MKKSKHFLTKTQVLVLALLSVIGIQAIHPLYLKPASESSEVPRLMSLIELQRALRDCGAYKGVISDPNEAVDGMLGPDTVKAMKQWERMWITQDSIKYFE